MSGKIFARWFQRQGYKVFQTVSSYWVEVSPRIYQAIPYHQLIAPADRELDQFLKENGGIALRYSAPLNANSGAVSYHVVLDKAEYSLASLPKKARYDVRKGLKSTKIEQIPFQRMAVEGWQIRLETLLRQGRQRAESLSWWKSLCKSADGLEGFEAWAAIWDNKLVASLIAYTSGDTCSILYQQSSTEHLSLGVNNALAYRFTQEVFSRSEIERIFYGLHSLDAPSSVDQFKFRMRFSAKPVRQRVVFHPNISPVVTGASHAVLRGGKWVFSGIPKLAKAEGMVRFYLYGKQGLSEQKWPEILQEQKAAILAQEFIA